MIPNGCDLSLFQPGRREDLDLPGIGPEDCVAAFTGAHGIANGLDAVLDAARVLQERGRNDIVLAFIGDGKLKPHLIKRARSEGLNNCRFFDPMPKNRLNYISSGLPVINNYPGWLADMIREHRCGLAVPPRDPEAFADALCRLADNPELRREYGKNARRLAKQAFSREKLSNRFADFLEMNGS
jgi:glycosyltransferase involved in cell wall biosynthesis